MLPWGINMGGGATFKKLIKQKNKKTKKKKGKKNHTRGRIFNLDLEIKERPLVHVLGHHCDDVVSVVNQRSSNTHLPIIYINIL
jgi:hypothetical protein